MGHGDCESFFDQNAAQLITSPICSVEVLWLLGNLGDPRVLAAQNHLHGAVSRGGINAIKLVPEDYARIAELNQRYADLPGDFADLTLVTLSERLDIADILSLDSDFDVYRRFRRKPFRRVPPSSAIGLA